MWNELVNALLAHACLGLDCHEFSSAPASRASPPPETHACTPREREIERDFERERELIATHTQDLATGVGVGVCVYLCVCVCVRVCVCVCLCVYFEWACVCDCCHVRTSRGLSDDRIRPPCSIEDAASDAKRTRKIFACVAKKHLLEQHQSSPPSHLARA